MSHQVVRVVEHKLLFQRLLKIWLKTSHLDHARFRLSQDHPVPLKHKDKFCIAVFFGTQHHRIEVNHKVIIHDRSLFWLRNKLLDWRCARRFLSPDIDRCWCSWVVYLRQVRHLIHSLNKQLSFLSFNPLFMFQLPLGIYVLQVYILLEPSQSLFLHHGFSFRPCLRQLFELFEFELVQIRMFWQGRKHSEAVVFLRH